MVTLQDQAFGTYACATSHLNTCTCFTIHVCEQLLHGIQVLSGLPQHPAGGSGSWQPETSAACQLQPPSPAAAAEAQGSSAQQPVRPNIRNQAISLWQGTAQRCAWHCGLSGPHAAEAYQKSTCNHALLHDDLSHWYMLAYMIQVCTKDH